MFARNGIAVFCLTLIVPPFARADDAFFRQFEASPLLMPEHCATAPPQTILAEALKAGLEVDCETCVDAFYEVYAERLRSVVDARYPKLKSLRRPLTQAIWDMDKAIAQVTGGNWFGHETSRIPGRAEWTLIQIGRGTLAKSINDGPGYSVADIERIAITYAQANTELEGQRKRELIEKAFIPLVRSSLENLNKVETDLDAAMVRGLRRMMLKRLSDFL